MVLNVQGVAKRRSTGKCYYAKEDATAVERYTSINNSSILMWSCTDRVERYEREDTARAVGLGVPIAKGPRLTQRK